MAASRKRGVASGERGLAGRERGGSRGERGAAERERRPSGGGGRASATIGPGQLQQLQASVERRAEEEAARSRQPSRALGQEERRAGRAQGRHAQTGRGARSDRAAYGQRLSSLLALSHRCDADGDGEETGIRSAREADRGHRTPGLDLLLRGLRLRDEGRVSRGRRRGCPIRRADQSGGDLSQRPAADSRGPGRPDDERSVRRAASLPRQPHDLGGRQGGGVGRGGGAYRRPCGAGAGAPCRRNRLSRRRQRAMAAYGLDRGPDLLSGVGEDAAPSRRALRAASSCTIISSPITA